MHVSPQATAQEIKAAYRKLAFKYHPDRNKGNSISEAILKDINEAYGVLSNPEKRKKYNDTIVESSYSFKQKQPTPVSSQSILQHAIKLKMFIERSNLLSINQDVVFHKVQSLLSNYHQNILLQENNPAVIHLFIQQVLFCMRPLTSNDIQPLLLPLKKLAGRDEAMQKEIHTFYQAKKV